MPDFADGEAAPASEPAKPETPARENLFRGVEAAFANLNVRLSAKHQKAIVHFLNESRNQYRSATVFFMDITGFTTLCQRVKAEDIEEFLHAYYSIFVSTVEFYNGFVVEFQGDGGHAVFGAPMAYERDAEAAVRAALDIRERIRALPPMDGNKIRVSCGLATGSVLSSIVHLESGPRYKIYGHAVNLSARIQNAAGSDNILTDPETYALTKDRFDFEEMPETQFKNVAKPIHTYVVKQCREVQDAPTAAGIPFVGRQHELKALKEIWNHFEASGKSGQPEPQSRGAILKGSGGIGKTRLAWEFASTILPRDQIISVSRAPHETKIPWGLWRAVIMAACGGRQTDNIAEIRADLNAALDRLGFAPEDRDVFFFMFALPEGVQSLSSLPPKIQRRLVASQIRVFLERRAGSRALLLLLDDIQWADSSSLEVLDNIIGDNCPQGVFFLLLARQEAKVTAGQLPGLKCIQLEALDQSSARTLANALSATTDILPELLDTLSDRAEGNPFYIVELFRMLDALRCESAAIAEASASGMAPITADEIRRKIPRSLVGLIQARIDLLDQRRRAVLECGAILGQRFALQMIELFDQIRDSLLAKLYSLRALEYLDDLPRPEGPEFLFHHGLFRDVTYESLPEKQRRALHGEIALQIEKHYGDRAAEDLCPLLAYHFGMSDHDEKAIDYYELAGHQACAMGALAEALDHNSAAIRRIMALPCSRKNDERLARQHRQRGISLRFRGDGDGARQAFEEALHLARKREMPSLCADLRYHLGLVEIQAGNLSAATRTLKSALREALRIADRPLMASIHNACGVLEWDRGQFRRAQAYYAKAIEYGIEKSNPDSAADIHNNLALLEWKNGRLESAGQRFRRALRFQSRSRNRFGLAITKMNLGIAQENLGKYKNAQKTYLEALEIAEKIQYLPVMTATHANLANLCIAMGKAPKALDHSARSAELAERSNDKRSLAIAMENIALSHLIADDIQQASQAEAEARQLAEQLQDKERLLSLDLVKAEILIQSNDFAVAGKLLDESQKAILKEKYRSEWPRFWRLSAQLAIASGQSEKARACCKKGLREAAKQGNRSEEMRLGKLPVQK